MVVYAVLGAGERAFRALPAAPVEKAETFEPLEEKVMQALYATCVAERPADAPRLLDAHRAAWSPAKRRMIVNAVLASAFLDGELEPDEAYARSFFSRVRVCGELPHAHSSGPERQLKVVDFSKELYDNAARIAALYAVVAFVAALFLGGMASVSMGNGATIVENRFFLEGDVVVDLDNPDAGRLTREQARLALRDHYDETSIVTAAVLNVANAALADSDYAIVAPVISAVSTPFPTAGNDTELIKARAELLDMEKKASSATAEAQEYAREHTRVPDGAWFTWFSANVPATTYDAKLNELGGEHAAALTALSFARARHDALQQTPLRQVASQLAGFSTLPEIRAPMAVLTHTDTAGKVAWGLNNDTDLNAAINKRALWNDSQFRKMSDALKKALKATSLSVTGPIRGVEAGVASLGALAESLAPSVGAALGAVAASPEVLRLCSALSLMFASQLLLRFRRTAEASQGSLLARLYTNAAYVLDCAQYSASALGLLVCFVAVPLDLVQETVYTPHKGTFALHYAQAATLHAARLGALGAAAYVRFNPRSFLNDDAQFFYATGADSARTLVNGGNPSALQDFSRLGPERLGAVVPPWRLSFTDVQGRGARRMKPFVFDPASVEYATIPACFSAFRAFSRAYLVHRDVPPRPVKMEVFVARFRNEVYNTLVGGCAAVFCRLPPGSVDDAGARVRFAWGPQTFIGACVGASPDGFPCVVVRANALEGWNGASRVKRTSTWNERVGAYTARRPGERPVPAFINTLSLRAGEEPVDTTTPAPDISRYGAVYNEYYADVLFYCSDIDEACLGARHRDAAIAVLREWYRRVTSVGAQTPPNVAREVLTRTFDVVEGGKVVKKTGRVLLDENVGANVSDDDVLDRAKALVRKGGPFFPAANIDEETWKAGVLATLRGAQGLLSVP